ncbi:hypothetical protein M419DRAFT_123852 [Trichoderma reesei RUT C-30]|uniref:Uncharacterized protein n=1 Tax=Hypocrea jecorina (strain ATCC 56765 / BCRC 32924 / NRRL 11460 / Rut C-30) TaxID=1344414 RepID=A0A024S696_HYPJR|nr:hypothetical protein M419DRAFT_123852 [Trichoderma reesei RUT C-30]
MCFKTETLEPGCHVLSQMALLFIWLRNLFRKQAVQVCAGAAQYGRLEGRPVNRMLVFRRFHSCHRAAATSVTQDNWAVSERGSSHGEGGAVELNSLVFHFQCIVHAATSAVAGYA